MRIENVMVFYFGLYISLSFSKLLRVNRELAAETQSQPNGTPLQSVGYKA